MRSRPSVDTYINEVFQPAKGERHELERMPLRFRYEFAPVRHEVICEGETFWQRSTIEPLAKRGYTINPYRLRAAFERVDGHKALIKFLEICGPFREKSTDQKITWPEFRGCQDFVRHILTKNSNPPRVAGLFSPEDYLEMVEQPEHQFMKVTTSRGAVPYLEIVCRTALKTVAFTAFLDRLHGKGFRVCELEGCRGTFRLSGQKKFCSDRCKEAEKSRTRRERETGGRHAKAAK